MQLSTFVMVGPPRFSIIPLSARRLRRTQARLGLQAPSALSLSLAWIRQHRPGLHRLMKLHGSDAVAVLLIHLQSRVSNFHPMHVSVVDTDCQSGQRSTLSCTSVPIALHTSTRGTEFPLGFPRKVLVTPALLSHLSSTAAPQSPLTCVPQTDDHLRPHTRPQPHCRPRPRRSQRSLCFCSPAFHVSLSKDWHHIVRCLVCLALCRTPIA
jgi:hypothetical protein